MKIQSATRMAARRLKRSTPQLRLVCGKGTKCFRVAYMYVVDSIVKSALAQRRAERQNGRTNCGRAKNANFPRSGNFPEGKKKREKERKKKERRKRRKRSADLPVMFTE